MVGVSEGDTTRRTMADTVSSNYFATFGVPLFRGRVFTAAEERPGSGIEVGIDGPPPGLQTPSPTTWWLRRRGWRVVAGEYVKMIYYWMKY